MENSWDKRYSESGYAYGKEPNLYFKQEIDKLKPGRLLLPGEGEGRNAVYAAALGWEVYALDASTEGKKKAEKLASERNVRINYRVGDITDAGLNNEKFDAISLIYVHFPSQQRTIVHRKLAELLKKGGVIIIEAFSKSQIKNNSSGPKDLNMLYAVDELRKDFEGLKILELSELKINLSEGIYHTGTSDIIRMKAVL
ncbi:MAG: class I SAM-dependent methyltransferase [Bacteroidetes bacterium]|nr:class I SAM-dependent methyltransferase [Bacteroidota bacterium]